MKSLPHSMSRAVRHLRVFIAVAVLAPAATLSAAERDSLKLLAIGNSFSADATRLLPEVVHAGGKQLVIGRLTIGGCSLERHARHLREAEAGDPNGRAYKNFVDPKTGTKSTVTVIEGLQSEAWDVVTIQQWSQLSFKPETFQPYADQLIAAIRKHAPTAEIVVHQTWAYRDDHPWYQKDDGFTALKMHEGLTSTYRNFADGKGFRVLPSGDALHLARQTPRWSYVPDPAFDFKNPPANQLPDQRTSLHVGWQWKQNKAGEPVLGLDAIHCNTPGQYLGAGVWYATLFETDSIPEGYIPAGLTAEDTADLRHHALAAVKAERSRAARPVSTAAR